MQLSSLFHACRSMPRARRKGRARQVPPTLEATTIVVLGNIGTLTYIIIKQYIFSNVAISISLCLQTKTPERARC
jgi:hypothetical protein